MSAAGVPAAEGDASGSHHHHHHHHHHGDPSAAAAAEDQDKNNQESEKVADKDVTLTAKICYYTFGFMAYWFGSARFDMDGDGDFDAADVQMMMNSGGKHMHLNFSRPPQNKKARKARKKAREAQKAKGEKEKKERDALHKEIIQESSASGGIMGAIAGALENVEHAVEEAADKADKVIEADVEDDAEVEEEEIMDNLKQFLPWFTIVEVLLIFGLWMGFALASRSYVQWGYNQPFPSSEYLLKTYSKSGTLYLDECKNECNAEDACLGIAFHEGPLSKECGLLKAMPTGGGGGFAGSVCPTDTWGWYLYKKQEFDFMSNMGMQGGFESRWPGLTALTSKYQCEEGFEWSFLWRWYTYQFTHGGFSHVASNSFMTIVLGVPLEGLHGTGYFAVMWTLGSLGGACCWLLFDPYRTSYGASGGCFSLLGMHVADLVMNWGQKKFRFGIVGMLALVTGVEIAGYYANHDPEGGGSATAHCVHVGGLIAGLLLGILLGRNIHEEVWEKRVKYACWALGGAMGVGSIIWWYAANPFPAIRNLWDLDESPWCWIGKVCIQTDGTPCPAIKGHPGFISNLNNLQVMQWLDKCVYCKTRECVEKWYTQTTYDIAVRGQITEVTQFDYCPRKWTQQGCHDEFNDDSDSYPGSGM